MESLQNCNDNENWTVKYSAKYPFESEKNVNAYHGKRFANSVSDKANKLGQFAEANQIEPQNQYNGLKNSYLSDKYCNNGLNTVGLNGVYYRDYDKDNYLTWNKRGLKWGEETRMPPARWTKDWDYDHDILLAHRPPHEMYYQTDIPGKCSISYGVEHSAKGYWLREPREKLLSQHTDRLQTSPSVGPGKYPKLYPSTAWNELKPREDNAIKNPKTNTYQFKSNSKRDLLAALQVYGEQGGKKAPPTLYVSSEEERIKKQNEILKIRDHWIDQRNWAKEAKNKICRTTFGCAPRDELDEVKAIENETRRYQKIRITGKANIEKEDFDYLDNLFQASIHRTLPSTRKQHILNHELTSSTIRQLSSKKSVKSQEAVKNILVSAAFLAAESDKSNPNSSLHENAKIEDRELEREIYQRIIKDNSKSKPLGFSLVDILDGTANHNDGVPPTYLSPNRDVNIMLPIVGPAEKNREYSEDVMIVAGTSYGSPFKEKYARDLEGNIVENVPIPNRYQQQNHLPEEEVFHPVLNCNKPHIDNVTIIQKKNKNEETKINVGNISVKSKSTPSKNYDAIKPGQAKTRTAKAEKFFANLPESKKDLIHSSLKTITTNRAYAETMHRMKISLSSPMKL